jgi:hypothetical protein
MMYFTWAHLAVVALIASVASDQFAQRLEPGLTDYGSGRIDAAAVKSQLSTLENQTATVCGRVNALTQSFPGRPTYIPLGEHIVTRQDFRISIPEANLKAFNDVNRYFGQIICVRGRIRKALTPNSAQPVPEIEATTPEQISTLPSQPRF